jgi:hypothetical protein
MKLTSTEQYLLDFARVQFGEHLSQFLLAGLGEGNLGQRERFTITYEGDDNAALKRQVQVITHEPLDGSSLLPQRRDPLVLLALLHLLFNGEQASPNSLEYKQEDVLSLLGWKDTKKARTEIDEAVRRYFLLNFKWKMNKRELARRKLSFYTSSEGLISENNIVNEEDADSGQIKRVSNRVVFNEHFIEHLRGRSSFGVDWRTARSVVLKFPSRQSA